MSRDVHNVNINSCQVIYIISVVSLIFYLFSCETFIPHILNCMNVIDILLPA
jgi:hypothetical protein